MDAGKAEPNLRFQITDFRFFIESRKKVGFFFATKTQKH